MYTTWVASLLLAIAAISGIQQQRHTNQAIGKDAVPSILLAQRLKDSLVGMDANAVNELLVKPGENPLALKEYEERRKASNERIIAAAENITYGDAERKPIQTMQLGLNDYIAKIQRARDFHERNDINGVSSTYREAAQIMDNTLLSAAEQLNQANLQQMERTYTRKQTAASSQLFFIIVSGLFLTGVLVAIQLFLNYKMRRILNPMLLAATAIAVVFLSYTTQTLLSTSARLKIAKEDAFESLYALRQSRALAYTANADVSRYLLDKTFAAKHEQAFLEKTAKIAKATNDETFESTTRSLKQGDYKGVGFTGFLADVFDNISFPGEREVSVATLSAFGRYLSIHKQIRQLEQNGQHQEAIALCVGHNQGQFYWAFNEFRKAHAKVQDINKEAFDKAIERNFKDVEGFEISAAVAAILISVLTLFGLLPRIKEYQ
ncbi:hypothetical protein F7734_40170 [Scytonema sp. UIC 10036]|uniref:hypothetical protein n=1 Tax=Scytonema sp. UIC 10036 TaxID=2304196 RepID=UPI0012DA4A64|nr:hypothetical protein [Scytonema sp. UIC 10036]MUG98197.1 hypothetical protein [Scytonema sp. UIC 10036]